MAACPTCGKELPAGEFPFCPFCATPLTESEPAAELEERKVVTVLFCDLVGFTAASEAADPEDVRARIRPYHARLRPEIQRYGGTVEKFIGDAVMAVFGAPVAHEDDSERAVRAALRILEAIAELNEQDETLSLQVRIGINTGEAVVVLDARPEAGEGIVTGDVVNTASRLQGAAPVNGIAVSEQTYRETERVFEYEDLEPVQVKGKTEPLALYRPLAARARFGSDVIRTHTTPLVGRELEKPLLIGTFERSAQQHSCQLVTIVGEPGVGKSRLCAELFAYLEDRADLVTWRQGRCLPYGDGIAFWALGEIVKAECGILESDSPGQAAAKLERTMPVDEPDLPWLAARLQPLIGAGGEPAAQEESFTAWRRFLESLAAKGPTVLVFEDLHWADQALLDFLEHLADWSEEVPLLLLCTARPELQERHPTWAAGLRNATTINLAPLTEVETARLISALLERAVLPAETQQALLERAGGNPLYAEEFVHLLADRGELGAEEVPASVQALIAARLDTLSPERKSLLQDAAVLGKVFWAGALSEMGSRDARDVEQALHELARKELVRRSRTSSMEGESEYGFWHLLVHDVCYGQIPRAARADRHVSAAAWIERKAGDRVEDLADVLAHHYLSALELSIAAGQIERTDDLRTQAIRYLALAGERALPLDVDRAEQNLARALELCPSGDLQRPQLLEQWSRAAGQQGRLREVRAALEEALGAYRERADARGEGRTMVALALTLSPLGDAGAAGLLDEAVEVLEAEPPGPELVEAYVRLSGFRLSYADFPAVITAADRAVSLAAELGLREPAEALGFGGAARAALGDRRGLEEMYRARELAVDRGEVSAAGVYNNLAAVIGLYEGNKAALEAAYEAIEFSRRRGLRARADFMETNLPATVAATGQSEAALKDASAIADRLEEAGKVTFLFSRSVQLELLAERGAQAEAPPVEPIVTAARESGELQLLTTVFVAAAQLLLVKGRQASAEALLEELERVPDTRTDPVFIGRAPRVVRMCLALGNAALGKSLSNGIDPITPLHEHVLVACNAQLEEAAGDHGRAAGLYAEAAERWRGFGDVPELAYALLGQGRCLIALGNAEAEEPLRQARELFQELGYEPALAQAERLLEQTTAAAS